MKKFLKYVGIVLLIVILFRGFIYRQIMTYEIISARSAFPVKEKNIKEEIFQKIKNKNIEGKDDLIAIILSITNQQLHFSTDRISSNPNDSFFEGRANCVGYAASFKSIGDEILQTKGLDSKYEIRHVVCEMELFGYDIHQLIDHAFFQDHDINEIIDLKTGESTLIDPSLYDYSWIKKVTKYTNLSLY